MGRRFVGLAAVFYAALLSAAVVLNGVRGGDAFALGDSLPFGLAVGTATACGTAPLLVDGAKGRYLVLVSVFSGVGEEAFFRGALQPVLGLVLTSLLFGVLHVGPDRRYLVWSLWAVAAGFLFGFLYEWTGGLLAPMTAHVLHNAATLLLWRRSRTLGGKASGGSVAMGEEG